MKITYVIPLCAALAVFSLSPIGAAASVKGIAAAASESAVERAVSSLNGKLDANYGAVNRTSIRGLSGTVSFPIGQRLGAQVDALYQHGLGTNIFGAGGHFFARDPGKGLFGLAFSGTTSQKFTDLFVGLEGEYYFKSVTLGAVAGYDNYDVHIPTSLPALTNQRSYVATRVYAAIYPMDDLMLRLEHQSRFNHNFYVAHVEWQTPLRGVAVYVNGGVGENNYSHLMAGVRFYFGGNKPLKDRHRKDDPDNINATFIGTSVSGASQTASSPPTPSDAGGSGGSGGEGGAGGSGGVGGGSITIGGGGGGGGPTYPGGGIFNPGGGLTIPGGGFFPGGVGSTGSTTPP